MKKRAHLQDLPAILCDLLLRQRVTGGLGVFSAVREGRLGVVNVVPERALRGEASVDDQGRSVLVVLASDARHHVGVLRNLNKMTPPPTSMPNSSLEKADLLLSEENHSKSTGMLV